jgi:hypothetical protein
VVDDNSNSVDCDDVRAPIPQKIEKLLNYDPYALALAPQNKRMRVNAFDGYRNDDNQPSYEGNSSSKSKSLGALFRPPVDLLFNASFEASKIQGCKTNKWVLVNVQNQIEFNCQSLNRDVWSDATVKEIVKENFIFIQIYCDSLDGKKLINYYNIASYPFVAIIDPRTGEKLMQFNSNKLDQLMFCEKITTFLGDYEMPMNESEFEQYNISNNSTTQNSKKTNGTNQIIKVDDEDDVVELNGFNNNNSKLNPLHSKTKVKSQKANEILNSIVTVDNDKNTEEDVEIEDNSDILSTDGSSSNNSSSHNNDFKINKNATKMNGNYKNGNSEDVEVNVEENSDEEVCISKEKYDREKLLKKEKLLNGITTNCPTAATAVSNSKLNPQTNNNHVVTSNSTATLNTTAKNTKPTQTRYETPDSEQKDCVIRISYPNGDRLDFCTNGNSKIKVLLDYLTNQGYNKNVNELIERLMPNTKSATTDETVTNQSRNLFNSNLNLTFKQMSLYPRVALLLQEC